jgi:hypothetical protein
LKRFFVDIATPLAYLLIEGTVMVFIETPIFTRQVEDLLSEDQYRWLQNELRKRPDAGLKIKGSGGLRKTALAG